MHVGSQEDREGLISSDLKSSKSTSISVRAIASHFFAFIAGALLLQFGRSLSQGTNADITLNTTPAATSDRATSPVPYIPFEDVVFKENTSFMTAPSIESQQLWNSLLPPGRGFVFVDNPEQYGLPPGQQTDDGPIYSVSLFHQLHCLGQIREAHWVLLHSVEVGRTRKAAALLGPHGDHVKHCLDYLRQSLMCNGDMTLEAPLQDGAGAGFAVDGWGVTHQCKSWSAIDAYMSEKHFNGSMNPGIAG